MLLSTALLSTVLPGGLPTLSGLLPRPDGGLIVLGTLAALLGWAACRALLTRSRPTPWHDPAVRSPA